MPVANIKRLTGGRLAVAISSMVVRVLRDSHRARPDQISHPHDRGPDLGGRAGHAHARRAPRSSPTTRPTLVLAARRAFHDTMRAELIDGIEELTGRTVIAFFSDNAIDPDIALKSFLLAPQDADAEDVATEASGRVRLRRFAASGSLPPLSALAEATARFGMRRSPVPPLRTRAAVTRRTVSATFVKLRRARFRGPAHLANDTSLTRVSSACCRSACTT